MLVDVRAQQSVSVLRDCDARRGAVLDIMTKTIIVAGFGPGISSAVAERFGKEGFTIALVARRSTSRMEELRILADIIRTAF